MGGESVSSGAENQAEAAAFVAIRMLLQRPLNWTGRGDDVPVAVTGEVGGPGDDLRVSLTVSQAQSLEVQNKRALVGQAALREVIREMAKRLPSADSNSEIVLAVSSGSSVEIRDRFSADVRLFRQGRRQDVRSITRDILAEVEGAEAVLARLSVVTLDADRDFHAQREAAIDQLRAVLVQPERADDVWDVLVKRALKIGQKERWTRQDLVSLFNTRGWVLKPIGPDAALLEQIEFGRTLNKSWRHRTSAGVLEHVREEVRAKAVEGDTRRQFHGVRGACAMALGDPEQAVAEFNAALDFLPIRPDAATSPDVRKKWCDARSNLAWATHFSGDADEARSIANDVLAMDDHHVNAWALLARIGVPGLAPPDEVPDSTEYRLSQAHAAVREGDWRGAAEILAASAMTSANPESLHIYAQSLFNLSTDSAALSERKSLLERSERAASEAVRILENGELDRILATIVLVRGRAREALGLDAERDFEWASRLDPTEPNVLMRAVSRRAAGGDLAGAAALISDAAAESIPAVRLLRADLRTQLRERAGATGDISRVLDELPSAATAASLSWHLKAAELALDLEEPELARRALDAIEAGKLSDQGPDAHVMRGRLAATLGDTANAEKEFRAAVDVASLDEKALILSELGTVLARVGRRDDAIAIFEEAGASAVNHPAFPNFVIALMKSERFERVVTIGGEVERELVKQGRGAIEMPGTLVEALIDIAWRREDYATAARFVDALLAQEQAKSGTARTSLLLNAALVHSSAGNNLRSTDLVDEVLKRVDLKPPDRMRAAQVLLRVGARERALETAFTAVRAMPNDKNMIGSFIHVAITPTLRRMGAVEDEDDDDTGDVSDVAAAAPAPTADTACNSGNDDVGDDGRTGTVTPGSFVRIVTPDHQVYEYFIYHDGPTDARLNEYLVTDPAVSDLVGRSVGDVVVRNPGTWGEQRLRIDRVIPAVVIVVRRYMRTFAVQHPDSSFLKMFNVGKVPTAETIAPIVAELHRAKDAEKRALDMYNESPLPLGVVARATGRSLIQVTAAIAGDEARRVWVDGPPFTMYGDGVRSAREAESIVVTRPALFFLDLLGVLDAVIARYELIAPKSMLDEWAEELRELEETNERGNTAFYEVGGRLGIGTRPAGAAESWLVASRTLHERVIGAARAMHRPAFALGAAADEMRETLGAASYDAAALAKSEGAALYADDLALRVVASQEFKVPTVATIHLLETLRADGRISDDAFDHAVVRLVELGQDMLPIRPTTIASAFTGAGKSPHASRLVLECLADPRITSESAAIVAAGGLAAIVRSRIVTVGLDDAANMTAEVLLRHREPSEVLPTYLALLRNYLRLLPLELRKITAATARARENRRLLDEPES